MRGKPLEFCAHLARAIRTGAKTTTWKPLSPADQERRNAGYTRPDVPFQVGSTCSLMEAWGYLNGVVAYVSTYAADAATGPFTLPPEFKLQDGLRSEKSIVITSCSLMRLSTITEGEAVLAGTIPPDGSTYLAEFERQWRSVYRGPVAWEADPFCWRIGFQLES